MTTAFMQKEYRGQYVEIFIEQTPEISQYFVKINHQTTKIMGLLENLIKKSAEGTGIDPEAMLINSLINRSKIEIDKNLRSLQRA